MNCERLLAIALEIYWSLGEVAWNGQCIYVSSLRFFALQAKEERNFIYCSASSDRFVKETLKREKSHLPSLQCQGARLENSPDEVSNAKIIVLVEEKGKKGCGFRHRGSNPGHAGESRIS